MKIETAELALSAHSQRDFVRDGLPQVAFVGRSNVGKSSLLNRLLGRRGLARTSSTPGRTRSINYFLINRRFYFVDLPGYGYAKAGKADRQAWAELIELYFRQAPRSASRFLVVQLVDGKVGATRLDAEAFEYLAGFGVAVAAVATKIDKVGRSKRAAALAGIGEALGFVPGAAALPVSARTGEGIKELWGAIDGHLELPVG